jgi:very-short-patch-repair endonuclease
MRKEGANSEVGLSRVAARQHGIVTRAQLNAAGIGDAGITRRIGAGRLHRVHRGVYAVGHPKLTFEGRCLAAASACGPAAVVSHRSAAALWTLLPPHSGPIEVTLPTANGRRRRSGITIHRTRSFGAGFSTHRNAVPVTTPARTLRDLERTAPEAVAQRAFRRALDLRLVPPDALRPEPDLTRSALERRFLALCRRHHLPPPEVNARVRGYEADFLWRDHRLIVETDGYRHHSDRAAFEADRARDAHLQAAGYRVLRFTYRQVERSPKEVASSVRALIECGDGPHRFAP